MCRAVPRVAAPGAAGDCQLLGHDGARITGLRPGARFTEAMEEQLRG